MHFLNLTALEFLGLFAGLSAVVTALYLLDRSRQKHRVATLRFWVHSDAPTEMQHRRRIQQPWSLLLQIVSLLCLLLALAQLRWGSPLERTRDHVLILDNSAVMAARTSQGVWMDQARLAAKQWLKAVPAGDRVMLVRADGLATAATAFESRRQVVDEAISLTRPTSSALQLESALRYAKQSLTNQGRLTGEIVYAGAGWIADEDSGFAASLPNLRVLPLKGTLENIGIAKLGLRRSHADERIWEVYGAVRNDGLSVRQVPVALTLGGAPMGLRQLTIGPRAEQNFTIEVRTDAAGLLETRLQVQDGFDLDDQASLELPNQAPLRVSVYSNDPDALRPLFAHPRLQPIFRKPAEYSPNDPAAAVVIDRFTAQPPARSAALYIDPPKDSPISLAGSVSGAELTRWHNENPLGLGLHSKDVRLDRVSTLRLESGDLPVAECSKGVIIAARPSRRIVVMGFHPMLSPLRFELATPLLFANVWRWMAPEVFLRWEVNAGAPGSIAVPVEPDVSPGAVRATADGAGSVPFSVSQGTLRFFAGNPGVVRVNDGRREMVFSLTLPDVGRNVWSPPTTVRRGVPAVLESGPVPRDLWQWLAVAGTLGLIAEWMLFGRARRLYAARPVRPESVPLRRAS